MISINSEANSGKDFKGAVKMFLGDPKLAYKPYFELKQILEQRNDDGGEFSIKDPIKDVKTDVELPKIPGLILLSCYLTAKNPENMDRKIFRNHQSKKGQIKKTKPADETKQISRAPAAERIIAVAQTLASINFNPMNYERQIFYQTFEYLSSFK